MKTLIVGTAWICDMVIADALVRALIAAFDAAYRCVGPGARGRRPAQASDDKSICNGYTR